MCFLLCMHLLALQAEETLQHVMCSLVALSHEPPPQNEAEVFTLAEQTILEKALPSKLGLLEKVKIHGLPIWRTDKHNTECDSQSSRPFAPPDL